MTVDRLINVYSERGKPTFQPSGPDRDPEWQLITDDTWSIEDDELRLDRAGKPVVLTATGAILAARYGSFGLRTWEKQPAVKPSGRKRKQSEGIDPRD